MTEIESIFCKKENDSEIKLPEKLQIFDRRLERIEETLLPELNDKQSELFERYKEMKDDYIEEVKSIYFTDGFITGGKIISEVLTAECE